MDCLRYPLDGGLNQTKLAFAESFAEVRGIAFGDPLDGGFNQTKPALCAFHFRFLKFGKLKADLSAEARNKKPAFAKASVGEGGERGIRTPGGLHLNGFQDRRIRPLCHLSGAKVSVESLIPKKL